jgi:flavin reductase (DIM6/NTAB) family NADH-FMN oxidoreductase RutF
VSGEANIHDALRQTVGKALGRIPSGVFVLTASDGANRYGMLASWVQQAAFDPPAISMALGKDRPILPLILSTKRLGLCVIGEGEKELMKRFARPKPGEDAFEGLELIATPSGLPVPSHALAWLDCEVITSVDFDADHALIVARVVAGDLLRDGHSFTHVRGNGFHY